VNPAKNLMQAGLAAMAENDRLAAQTGLAARPKNGEHSPAVAAAGA